MYKNLETYLEEISHFLSGREEREEILSEIRSHILEKAEREVRTGRRELRWRRSSPPTEATPGGRKIPGGPADHRPGLPALFIPLYLAAFLISLRPHRPGRVISRKASPSSPSSLYPAGIIADIFLYVPTAFLTDFGIVALVLYYITWTGKDTRLPWPKFAIDLNEARPVARVATMIGAGVMLALTVVAVRLFLKFQTLFVVSLNFEKFQPLFRPVPGRLISLAVLAMMAAGTIGWFIKAFSASRRLACWVDAVSDGFALVMIAIVLRQQHAPLFAVNVPAELLAWSTPHADHHPFRCRPGGRLRPGNQPGAPRPQAPGQVKAEVSKTVYSMDPQFFEHLPGILVLGIELE